MITPKEYYSSRMDSLAARIAIHRRRNRLFVGGEIASFALFIAFIFAYAQLEWGSMGVWVDMVADWFIRIAFYLPRYLSGRWLKKKVI